MTFRPLGDAPPYVRERGGVLASLWQRGADETDIAIVSKIIERCERYRDALEYLANSDAPGVDDLVAQFAREALR